MANEIKNKIKFDRTPMEMTVAFVVMALYFAIGLSVKDIAALYTPKAEPAQQETTQPKKEEPVQKKEDAKQDKASAAPSSIPTKAQAPTETKTEKKAETPKADVKKEETKKAETKPTAEKTATQAPKTVAAAPKTVTAQKKPAQTPQQTALKKYKSDVLGVLRANWHPYPKDLGEAVVRITINSNGKHSWYFTQRSDNEFCNASLSRRLDFMQFPKFTEAMNINNATFTAAFHKTEGSVDILDMSTEPYVAM